MHQFTYTSPMPCTAQELFQWHEREGAFERLIPPWNDVSCESKDPGIKDGARAHLVLRQGILRIHWLAQHMHYKKGESFTDLQVKGPFAYWKHTHTMRPLGMGRSELQDQITFALPGGALINRYGEGFARAQLNQMFAYRHRITAHDLACISRYPEEKALKIAVTGSKQFLPSQLIPFLKVAGHHVISLEDPHEAHKQNLEELDALLHLWEPPFPKGSWSSQKREKFWKESIQTTESLMNHLSQLHSPPSVILNGSSMLYYGSQGMEFLHEQAPRGEDFLSQLYEAREKATSPLQDSRVVQLRLAMVLSPKGGVLSTLMRPFQLGLGGHVGGGRQYWSWVSLDDSLYQIYHLLMTKDIAGAVNLTSPHPTSSKEFASTLGKTLSRPSWLPLPKGIAPFALGHGALPLLYSSRRGVPSQLNQSGFSCAYPTLEAALAHLTGRPMANPSPTKREK